MNECATRPLLPVELSIYTAADTRSLYLNWIADGTLPVEDVHEAMLDGSRVDVVDGSGVQLLMSLARTLSQRGVEMAVVAPSEPLRAACEALGASHLVGTA